MALSIFTGIPSTTGFLNSAASATTTFDVGDNYTDTFDIAASDELVAAYHGGNLVSDLFSPQSEDIMPAWMLAGKATQPATKEIPQDMGLIGAAISSIVSASGRSDPAGSRSAVVPSHNISNQALEVIGTSSDGDAVRKAVRELLARDDALKSILFLRAWINRRHGMVGVREPASLETRNIIGQEMLNHISIGTVDGNGGRYSEILSDIFTGCGDSAIVAEAVKRLLNIPDMSVVLFGLNHMLLQIDSPIPRSFRVASPDARRILGKAILENEPLFDKLKSDARFFRSDEAGNRAGFLLDPAVQASRDVELLLEIMGGLLYPSQHVARAIASAGAVLVGMFEEGALADTKDPRVLTAIYQYTDKPDIVEYVFENSLFGEGKERLVDLIRRGIVGAAAVSVAGEMLQRLDRTHAPVVYIVARHHEDKNLRKAAVDRLAGFGKKFHPYLKMLFVGPIIGQGAYSDTQRYARRVISESKKRN